MSSSGASAPNSCTWRVHSSLTGAEVYIPLYIYTHVSAALDISRVRWRWIWKFGGWARKRMKDSKSTRNRNMKESIIVHGDLGLMFSWCLLFLRLLGSPSLSLWLAKSTLIRSKEIYLLDGGRGTLCWLQASKRKNGREGLRAVASGKLGMGTWRN